MLAMAGAKYVALGLVLSVYATAFRDVNGMFNAFSDFIANSTTGGDVFQAWMADLSHAYNEGGSEKFFDLIMGGVSAILGLLPMLIGYILYPITYVAFCFFYSFYGAVPLRTRSSGDCSSSGVWPRVARACVYIINLMAFHFWGVIYAVFCALMAAVNLSTVGAVIDAGSFLGGFVGLEQSLLLGVASIFYSLAIATIPFASRIVRGAFSTGVSTLVSKVPALVGLLS
jgi:hypothetical protein